MIKSVERQQWWEFILKRPPRQLILLLFPVPRILQWTRGEFAGNEGVGPGGGSLSNASRSEGHVVG